jgi:hypothetical protein
MKNAKKILIIALCAALCVVLLSSPATADGDSVYFAVVNETILELRPEYMPIRSDRLMYIPVSLFNVSELGVFYSYNQTDSSITFFNADKVLTFNLNTGIAYDQEKQYSQSILSSGGRLYVPAYFICEQFGLGYAYISTGPAVRITTSESKVGTALVTNISRDEFSRRKEEYEESLQPAQPGESPSSAPSPSPAQSISYVEIYLVINGNINEYTPGILDVLEEHGAKAAFFIEKDTLAENAILFAGLREAGIR